MNIWITLGYHGHILFNILLARLSINDSVYGCVFFFLTGLHFFHLVVGLFLLSLLSWSCSFSFRKKEDEEEDQETDKERNEIQEKDTTLLSSGLLLSHTVSSSLERWKCERRRPDVIEARKRKTQRSAPCVDSLFLHFFYARCFHLSEGFLELVYYVLRVFS